MIKQKKVKSHINQERKNPKYHETYFIRRGRKDLKTYFLKLELVKKLKRTKAKSQPIYKTKTSSEIFRKSSKSFHQRLRNFAKPYAFFSKSFYLSNLRIIKLKKEKLKSFETR